MNEKKGYSLFQIRVYLKVEDPKVLCFVDIYSMFSNESLLSQGEGIFYNFIDKIGGQNKCKRMLLWLVCYKVRVSKKQNPRLSLPPMG